MRVLVSFRSDLQLRLSFTSGPAAAEGVDGRRGGMDDGAGWGGWGKGDALDSRGRTAGTGNGVVLHMIINTQNKHMHGWS